MPRTKAKETVENLQEPQEINEDSSTTLEVSEITTENTSNDSKSKKKSQKESYKPFLLVADLGRSSCKFFVYLKEESSVSQQVDIVYSEAGQSAN